MPIFPALWEAEVGVSLEAKSEDQLGRYSKTPSPQNTKISWAWWHMPVVPATREAEAGELPEPRRRRLR